MFMCMKRPLPPPPRLFPTIPAAMGAVAMIPRRNQIGTLRWVAIETNCNVSKKKIWYVTGLLFVRILLLLRVAQCGKGFRKAPSKPIAKLFCTPPMRPPRPRACAIAPPKNLGKHKSALAAKFVFGLGPKPTSNL